jgi:hypothetical protein
MLMSLLISGFVVLSVSSNATPQDRKVMYAIPTGVYIWDASLGGGVTDEELRRMSENDRNARREADRVIAQRQEFRDSLREAMRARDALPEGDERNSLSESIKAYGNEGEANGVTVAVGTLPERVAAETRVNHFDYLEVSNSMRANLTVTFSNRRSNRLSIDSGHEGRHVADAQAFAVALTADIAAGGENAIANPLNRTRYEREVRAYIVSASIARGLALDNLNFGNNQIWNREWPETDRVNLRDRAINNYLRTSPTYNLTPENPGRRYL